MQIFKSIFLSCLAASPLIVPAWAQQDDVPDATKIDPNVSRELIRQWVKTERILSEEKTAWQVEKKRLQDLLDLYHKELKLLEEEIGQAGQSASLVDENKGKFEAELAEYREAQRLLKDTMARLLPRMKVLVNRLPQPLLNEVEADVEVIRQQDTLDKPRDILKSTIAVLTAAGQFNRTITLSEETRTISDDQKMTVNVLYLGLCRAYYATASGETAGIGVPGKSGWDWQPVAGLADDVRRTIAIYQKDKQPQLVTLPVKLSADENK